MLIAVGIALLVLGGLLVLHTPRHAGPAGRHRA